MNKTLQKSLASKVMMLWIAVFACLASPAWAAETASYEIVARDGKLFPPRLEVPAGVKLRLTVRNEGKTPIEFESNDLRVERVVVPNASTTVTLQPLKPGTYNFFDEFHADTGKMVLVAD